MFTINQGFDLNSPQFNFKRDYFASVADLKAAPETSFPDYFITNVAGALYQINKSNDEDETTGKWRKLQLGSDVDLSGYVTKANAISSITTGNQSVGTEDISQVFNYVNADKSTGTFGITISHANKNRSGLMTSVDKAKLDAIAEGANNYVLPTATAKALGGIKLGYTQTDKNYPVTVDADGNAYVNVPWTDNQDLSNLAKLDSDNTFTGANTFTDSINVTATTGKLGTQIYGGEISMTKGQEEELYFSVDNTGEVAATKFALINNGSADKLFASDGSLFDVTTLATKDALHATNSALSSIVQNNKVLSTALPIASTTALGAIKLGTGLSAAADGTVSVSADVVAGSVEWDAVKNKPNVAILKGKDNYFNGDAIQFKNTKLNNIYTRIEGAGIFVGTQESDHIVGINILKQGISLVDPTSDNSYEDTIFLADGTTAELKAISTDELNAILV